MLLDDGTPIFLIKYMVICVWCRSCLQGIMMSRVTAPEGVKKIDMFDKETLIKEEGATRWTIYHEYMHYVLQRKNGFNIPGEDIFIESFLER